MKIDEVKKILTTEQKEIEKMIEYAKNIEREIDYLIKISPNDALARKKIEALSQSMTNDDVNKIRLTIKDNLATLKNKKNKPRKFRDVV